jgi:D-glycero-alpha-D-manno-heptose 1-phosphate guanylyltransferase
MDHKVNEGIILAGGLGTRLRSAIGDYPKALAEINGQPFLHFLFKFLSKNGIEKVVLSVGYKWEMISEDFRDEYLGIQIKYAVEKEMLGTGGAIKFALEKTESETVFVMNGDTIFDIDLQAMSDFHFEKKSICTIAAKELTDFERYGTIDISNEGKVTAFHEKTRIEKGFINGGIYLIDKSITSVLPTKHIFSFEKDFLELNCDNDIIYAVKFEDYFIDIGIPVDYNQFARDMLK